LKNAQRKFLEGIRADMPQKLNDFFSDKTPTAAEKLTMFDLRNKNADLSENPIKKWKKSCFDW
jgi:hypothetical protein